MSRLKVSQSKVLVTVAVVISLLILGAGGWFVVHLVFTPTITIYVHNDLSSPVSVSGCGSDPLSLRANEQGPIDPNPDDPRAACLIYDQNTSYIGCLFAPTTVYRDGARVNVSQLDSSVSASSCVKHSS